MRRVASMLSMLLVIAASGMAQAQDSVLSGLEADLQSIEAQISAAEQEDALLAGGLVKTLIQLRLAILRNTEAMLDQKRAAIQQGIPITYVMKGEVYLPPEATPQELAEIEASIQEAEGEVAEARAEDAKYAGGLVKAMTATRIATAENSLAMLKQRWYVARYTIPFVTPEGVPSAAGAEGTDKAPDAEAETTAASEDHGWIVQEEINPVDDSRTVTVGRRADNLSEAERRRHDVLLVVRCMSNTPNVVVVWDEYLSEDRQRTLVRLGEGEAEWQSWSVATNNQAAFYPNDDADFIRALLGTDRLVLQTTPYGDSPITAVFDLTTFSQHVGPVLDTCNLR